jgi:hypothetical protein
MLNYVPRHEDYGRAEIQLYEFLISALEGGEWSASLFGHLTPMERVAGTHKEFSVQISLHKQIKAEMKPSSFYYF